MLVRSYKYNSMVRAHTQVRALTWNRTDLDVSMNVVRAGTLS